MHSEKRKKPVDFDRVYRCIACEPVVRPIISSYRLHLMTQLEELSSAFERDEWREVHRIAHTIKGGALNIGADELSSAALEMERKAADGDLTAARCGMHRMRRAANEVNRYILRRYKEYHSD